MNSNYVYAQLLEEARKMKQETQIEVGAPKAEVLQALDVTYNYLIKVNAAKTSHAIDPSMVFGLTCIYDEAMERVDAAAMFLLDK